MISFLAQCDRCKTSRESKTDLRSKLPKEWSCVVDTQTTDRSPTHLCPTCTREWRRWLANEPELFPQ